MFFDFIRLIIAKIVFFCSSIGGDGFPKPLSSEEEEKYLKLYKENGDLHAREILIRHNLRLVAHVAKKYQGAEEQDDIISVGSIGLIKAINSYETDKGTQLATYAARCIENEILMLIRANKKHKNNVSIYEGIGSDKEGNELTVMDLLAEKGEGVLDKVENSVLRDNFLAIMKNCLTEREYKIVCLRFGLLGGRPLAQREVASLMRISRSYVSRLEKKAIYKLRSEIKRNEFLE